MKLLVGCGFPFHEYTRNNYSFSHHILCSATGYASRTKPERGFEDPNLAQVFNKTTPVNEKILPNITTPTPGLPINDHSSDPLQSWPHIGAIVGSILGGFILFTVVFFILRRRQRMLVPPHPEMSTSTEPQELQEGGLSELYNPRNVPELPSLPIELDCSGTENKSIE